MVAQLTFWEWIINFIPHFMINVITYPLYNQSYFKLVKGILVSVGIIVSNFGTFCAYTEMKMSSFWRNFHHWLGENFRHWLHWKLSKWQLSVQPVTKIYNQNDNIFVSVYRWPATCWFKAIVNQSEDSTKMGIISLNIFLRWSSPYLVIYTLFRKDLHIDLLAPGVMYS